MVDGSTKLVGIIGNPVGHSLSPAMHNAAFQALGMNCVYVPLAVQPRRVGDALNGLIALGFLGANVTVPYKESVIPFVDKLSSDASCIGAVNTLMVKESQLLGFNTDWIGFLNHLSEIGFDVSRTSVLVLGSGGSARAVVYALCSEGSDVTICSRNTLTAEAIIRDISGSFANCFIKSVTLEKLGDSDLTVDIVVNTTPVGMSPNPGSCPWPEGIPFPKCGLAYDLVYDPQKTRFMEAAGKAGAISSNGLGMLVHQAAAAFKIWTGVEPPTEIMKKAVKQC